MPGFNTDSTGATTQNVVYADNVDFSGSTAPTPQVTTNGQLLIGSTPTPNIRIGTLTSPLGTLTIGYSSPNITIDVMGGIPTIKFAVDTTTGGGTNPVLPNGSGQVTVTGGQYATGAFGTRVITINSTAPNTFATEVQISTTSAASLITNNGVCHFNSADFTIDANGFVSTVGGPPITKVGVDANTAPGTNPVLPDGTGKITVTGGQVAAGTTTNVIQSNSLSANTYTVQIQRSQAVASSTVGDNGVSHFSSADFGVDSNGFVTGNGRTVKWQTITASQTLLKNNGYICISPGGALSLALPTTASSTIGDIIEVTLDGATSWTITQAAAQQIRFGSTQTTSGATGSLASTAAGDTIRMVYQASGKWNILSSIGNLTVV